MSELTLNITWHSVCQGCEPLRKPLKLKFNSCIWIESKQVWSVKCWSWYCIALGKIRWFIKAQAIWIAVFINSYKSTSARPQIVGFTPMPPSRNTWLVKSASVMWGRTTEFDWYTGHSFSWKTSKRLPS